MAVNYNKLRKLLIDKDMKNRYAQSGRYWRKHSC
jgi:hypothetical protein